MNPPQVILKSPAAKSKSTVAPEWATPRDIGVLTGYRGRAIYRLIDRLRAAGVRTIGRGLGLRINLADVRQKLDELAMEGK